MIWFIGGPARCGKTALRKKARPLMDGQVISYDAIKPALNSVVSGSDREKFTVKIDEVSNTPPQWVELLRIRDLVFWKFFKLIAEELTNKGENCIIEGNLWPDFIAELPPGIDHKAVFLVDTSSEHTERLISISRKDDTDNNWMKGWSDERIRHWATYDLERSHEIIRLGKKHDYPVFDVADGGLTAAQSRALEYLQTLVS